jgi:hypothetical protein
LNLFLQGARKPDGEILKIKEGKSLGSCAPWLVPLLVRTGGRVAFVLAYSPFARNIDGRSRSLERPSETVKTERRDLQEPTRSPRATNTKQKYKTQFCTKIPENSFFLFHVKEFSSVDPFENNDIISGKKIFKKYLKFKFRAISIFKKFQFFFKDSCGPVLCCQTSVEIQPESSAV